MTAFRLLRTESDYEEAQKRINDLIDSKENTPEYEELMYWGTLVEEYESRVFPDENDEVFDGDGISYLKEVMQLRGLTQGDLAVCFGNKPRVSETLARKRPLTIKIIRNLVNTFGMSAEKLIQETDIPGNDEFLFGYAPDFPFEEMFKAGWFKDDFDGTLNAALKNREFILTKFISNTNIPAVVNGMNHFYKDANPENGKKWEAELLAWRIRILNLCEKEKIEKWDKFRLSEDTFRFMTNLSVFEEGRNLAKVFLNKIGIHLIFLPVIGDIPVNGCCFYANDGCPVIALTDKVENLESFWFILCHEIAHLMLHIDSVSRDFTFLDNFLDNFQVKRDEKTESEADEFAKKLLEGRGLWNKSE